MVDRVSQAVRLSSGPQSTQIQQVGAGYVSPDFSNVEQTVGSGRSGVMDALLGAAKKITDKGFQRSLEDAYLDGVTKAATGQSEDTLDGDMFSKDWNTAGYRDTMGRLKIADMEARIAADMEQQAQSSPEQFNQYLAELRTGITPSLEGMSREQRTAAFQQLMLSQRSAIKTHATEHLKFIVDKEQQSVRSILATQFTTLTDRLKSGSGPDYTAAVDSAFGTIKAHVWGNSKFSPDIKRNLTASLYEQALNTNNLALADYMDRMPISADGAEDTMLGRLTLDQQEKLSGQRRTAEERTAGMRNTQFMDTLQNTVVAMEQGVAVPAYNDYMQMLNQGMQLGALSDSRRTELRGKWLESQFKYNNEAALASAYFLNKQDVIATTVGADNAKAHEAAVATLKRSGASILDQYNAHVLAGNSKNPLGYKSAAELASPSLAQLSSANVDPQHKLMIERVHSTLDKFDYDKDRVGKIEFLSGFSPTMQNRLQLLRDLKVEGLVGDVAVAEVLQREAKDASTTPAEKAAIAGLKATKDNEFITSIESTGKFKDYLNIAKGFMGGEQAGLRAAARVGQGAPAKVEAAYIEDVRTAVQEEFSRLGRLYPSLSQESRFESAQANIMRRTVRSKNAGPVIAPAGSSAQQFFGLNASNEGIAAAVDAVLIPASPGNTFTLTPAIGGRLVVQEYNFEGNPVDGVRRFLEPADVRAAYERREEATKQHTDVTVGDGKVVTHGGVSVKYNGANSSAVKPDLMLKLRDSLVQNERVSGVVYPDASNDKLGRKVPVFTGGVGVSSTNTKWFNPGWKEGHKLTPEEIAESFRGASNEAAGIGARLQKALRLNDSGFLLLSEMAYQGGRIHANDKYRPFLKALRAGDHAAAEAAFKSTSVYQVSDDKRRLHYLDLIKQTSRVR